MMGLWAGGALEPAEIIAQATKMAMPDAAKRTLADIGQQLAALADRQKEITVLQQKVDADRASFDKFVAETNAASARQAAALAGREATLQARTAAFSKVVAEFEGKLAAHAASLEITP